MLEIAERVRERAAHGAWIVDFTNPVGIVTRALLDAGHRAVGLCNVAISFQRLFARLLGVEPSASPSTRSASTTSPGCARCGSTATTCSPACSPTTATSSPPASGCRVRLLDELGALPSYYLRYFYAHDVVLAEQLDGVAARGHGRRDRARAARAVPRPER